MKTPTDIGKNRTGIATSPFDSKETIEGAEQGVPIGFVNPLPYAEAKLDWSRHAGPVGTMPPPLTLKGLTKSALHMMQGHKPTVFLDKLGQRVAFERSGVRLYEALIVKFEAGSPHIGGPTRDDLERIREDELRHFGLVRDAMTGLGADPTAMTPCADTAATMSLGIVQVLNDPRTTLSQGLEAVLAAELIDNDAWVMLVELADELGMNDLSHDFREALAQEEEHLARVRAWLSSSLRGQAGTSPTPPQQPGATTP